jgi:hypothetical protein
LKIAEALDPTDSGLIVDGAAVVGAFHDVGGTSDCIVDDVEVADDGVVFFFGLGDLV